jgi:hypothetical protein
MILSLSNLRSFPSAGGGKGTLDSWTVVRNYPFEDEKDGFSVIAYGGGRFVAGGT